MYGSKTKARQCNNGERPNIDLPPLPPGPPARPTWLGAGKGHSRSAEGVGPSHRE
jgi:hypothetical protein